MKSVRHLQFSLLALAALFACYIIYSLDFGSTVTLITIWNETPRYRKYKKSRDLSTTSGDIGYNSCSSRPFTWTQADLGTRQHKGTANPKYTFRALDAPGIQIIPDLCVEYESGCSCDGLPSTVVCQCDKVLVAYNAEKNGQRTLPVRFASEGVSKNNPNITIQHRRWKIPGSHIINNDVPTFFVAHSFSGNLYHFINDAFVGVYGIMKATGRLGAKEGNQILYQQDEWACRPKARSHNLSKFEKFLFSLSILPKHDWYKSLPAKSCFSKAVFGFYPQNISPAEPYAHIKGHMIGKDYLQHCPDKHVTIIQRLNRRILNIDEVEEAVKEAGFPHTKVYTFEYLTLKQQLSVIACTNILVGVQGAALEWFHFAKAKRAMIEIVWEHWPPFFAAKTGGRTVNLHSSNVTVNWESFEKGDRPKKPPLTAQEKHDLLFKKIKKLNHNNVWKWADVTVDVIKLKTAMEKAAAIVNIR